jgi:hypothetical protein
VLQLKDCGKSIAAQAGVGADPTIIVYGDGLTHVVVPPVPSPSFLLFVGKTDLGVSPITEGLLLRASATAKGKSGLSLELFALGVLKGLQILHHVGPVGRRGNAWFG